MGSRGRRSTAELSVLVDVRRARLQPPEHLGPDEQRRFIDLVTSCDPSHFRASDLPLLARYCEADVLAERAAHELQTQGAVVNGKPSPWIIVSEKAVRALVALSMRLRLSPQSRLDSRTIARHRPQGPRPWE